MPNQLKKIYRLDMVDGQKKFIEIFDVESLVSVPVTPKLLKKTITGKDVFGLPNNATITILRSGDVCSISFGGLSYDTFNVLPQSAGSDVKFRTMGEYIFWDISIRPNGTWGTVPEGYRSSGSIVTTMRNTQGDEIGNVYIGGRRDSGAIVLKFKKDEATKITSGGYPGGIRIGSLTYITEDAMPK